jgi:acyl carrier protein
MTRDEIRQATLDALKRIAPELDPSVVDPHASLRDELDIDSMDFLRFVLGLHERLGVDVPESDYPRLYTLDGAVSYLADRVQPAGDAH